MFIKLKSLVFNQDAWLKIVPEERFLLCYDYKFSVLQPWMPPRTYRPFPRQTTASLLNGVTVKLMLAAIE